MTKRIYALIGFITIAGFIIWQIASNKITDAQRVCESLITSRAIDRRYDEFLRYVFSETIKEMHLSYKLNINSKFSKNALNIMVVNFNFLNNQKIGDLSYAEFVNIAKDNFIAIQPNTVIIDHAYLSFLMLSFFNKSLAFFQGTVLSKFDTTTERFENPEILTTHEAASTLLSMGNYKWYRGKVEDNKVLPMEKTTAIISEYFKTGELELDEFSKRLWLLFFLPIVSHEIAHLKYDEAPTSGWFDLKTSFQNLLPAYAEEERADKVMKDVVLRVTGRDKSSVTALPIILFCKTMRNIVLVNAYDSFRNQRVEDLIITLEQKERLPADLLALRFDNIDRIAKGYENPPPPMTEREFYLFLKKFKESGSNLTHRHLLHRCQSLLEIVKPFTRIDLNFNTKYLDILNVNNDADSFFRRLFVEPLPELTTGLSLSKIFNGMSKEIRIVPAINHRQNKILIASFIDGSGYFEIAGDTANLAKISFVIRKPYPIASRESVRDYGKLLLFFLNAHNRPNIKVANKLIKALKSARAKCPAPFSVLAEQNTVRFIPQNDSEYLRITIENTKFPSVENF